jgi:hypothetical protein
VGTERTEGAGKEAGRKSFNVYSDRDKAGRACFEAFDEAEEDRRFTSGHVVEKVEEPATFQLSL